MLKIDDQIVVDTAKKNHLKFGLCLMIEKNYLNQHLSLTKSTGSCFVTSLMSNVMGSSKVLDSAMA